MPASFNGPNVFGVKVLDRVIKRAILSGESGMFLCRQLPCIQLCWPQEEQLPPLDTVHLWRPIGGLMNSEVDFVQKRLDLSRLGSLFSCGYGEPLIRILKHVICLLFGHPLLGKETHEIIDCQVVNRPSIGVP
jgi:hypothetical protein